MSPSPHSALLLQTPRLPLLITGVIDEAENIITLIGSLDPDDVNGLKANLYDDGGLCQRIGHTAAKGVTPNNIATLLVYRATAQNGSNRDYRVRVVRWQHPSSLEMP